jgi:hypothetical protein
MATKTKALCFTSTNISRGAAFDLVAKQFEYRGMQLAFGGPRAQTPVDIKRRGWGEYIGNYDLTRLVSNIDYSRRMRWRNLQ